MPARRLLPLSLFVFCAIAGATHGRFIDFSLPVDAISFGLPSTDEVLFSIGDQWHVLERLQEQDPLGRESNLLVFDHSISGIRLLSPDAIPHPIRVSHEPSIRMLAAKNAVDRSRIISRAEWGADESFLFASDNGTKPLEKGENGSVKGSEVSERIADCDAAHRNYPEEFLPERTVTTSPEGQEYRWPLEYSKDVRMLIVHHTAIEIGSDPRPAVERVRALYEFHAQNRGWGDVGYHYIIDEAGEIYEGRQGGDYVVGGHAYCANVGTVGVALLGNFELEQPTQDQMHALQWLLSELADQYGIPLDRKVRFHGKIMPTIARHQDVVSTECPGYYVRETISQVRSHVAAGTLTANIDFPQPFIATAKQTKKLSMERKAARTQRVAGGRSTGPLDRRLAAKLKSQPVTALRRQLRNRVEAAGGTARPGTPKSTRVAVQRHRSTELFASSTSSTIRIRLTSRETGKASCTDIDLEELSGLYRGSLSCTTIDGKPAIINALAIEEYMAGLAEEPDTEPFEKQKAFAIAARSYAAYWADPLHRKWEGMPYDGTDSPATFQMYGGITFERNNSRWLEAVRQTAGKVLTYEGSVVRAPYFSSDDGKTRSPAQAGWTDFPLADEVFYAKSDPWCVGGMLAGHGVGMSGCGAEGQANEGRSAEEILAYYYPGTTVDDWSNVVTAADSR